MCLQAAMTLLVVFCLPGELPAGEPATEALVDSVLGAAADAAAAITNGVESLEPAARELLAPVLVGWIEDTRAGAEARGVAAMPPDLRAAFSGRVPAAVLERVRWRIDDTLISVQQGLFRSGYTPALTVDGVILFADSDAVARPALWAHELAHVMQYADWGVDGFVARYLADSGAIEHAANELAWQWLQPGGLVAEVAQ
jgi:hypothetical protein